MLNSTYDRHKLSPAISRFNASPEPVRKGKALTVTGQLNRRIDAWDSFPGQRVYVYFRAKGSHDWTYKGVAATDRNDLFRKGFKAGKDGTWRVIYRGNTTYLPVTSIGDYVGVR